MPHLMSVVIVVVVVACIGPSNCNFSCSIGRCRASSCPIQRLLMTMSSVVVVVVIVVASANISTTTAVTATAATSTASTDVVCCASNRKRQVTCTRFHSVAVACRRQRYGVSKVAVYLLSRSTCVGERSYGSPRPTNDCR